MARLLPARRRTVPDPFETIDRLWNDPRFAPRPMFGDGETHDVRTDLFEEDGTLVMRASLPGLRREDLHVEVDDDEIHVWGERKEDTVREEGDVYLRENRYGRIERRVALPRDVDPETAKATFKDGVLTLRLPIREDGGHRELPIDAE